MSEQETIMVAGSSLVHDQEDITIQEGHLQIVEVTPFAAESTTSVLPDVEEVEMGCQQPKYIMDPDKGLVPLDLFNLTLVRCSDGVGAETYQLVTSEADSDNGSSQSVDSVTCYIEESEDTENKSQTYMMVDSEQGPVVLMKSPEQDVNNTVEENKEKKPLTTEQIIELAKTIKKSKISIKMPSLSVSNKRGRRRKGELPPPHVLLSSPNFKLYLYSCKSCNFKCNATKELTAHKNAEHGGLSKPRGVRPWANAFLQCPQCPFRANVHMQLMKHVKEWHQKEEESTHAISLDSKEADQADVLVCGACGYESSCKQDIRKHINDKHSS